MGYFQAQPTGAGGRVGEGHSSILRCDDMISFAELKEEVRAALPGCIERILGRDPEFHARYVEQWSQAIGQEVLTTLHEISRNFKYIVSMSIVERTGGRVHTSSAVVWDSRTDGAVSYRWESQAMVCIVQTYGVSI